MPIPMLKIKKSVFVILISSYSGLLMAEATGRTVTVRDDALWTVKITPGDFRHGGGGNGAADGIYGDMAANMDRQNSGLTKVELQNALQDRIKSKSDSLFKMESLSATVKLDQVEKSYFEYLQALYDTDVKSDSNRNISFATRKDSQMTVALKKASNAFTNGLKKSEYDESLKISKPGLSKDNIEAAKVRLYQAYIRYSTPFVMAVQEIISLGAREDYVGLERIRIQKPKLKTAGSKEFRNSYAEFIKEWEEVRRDILYDPYLVMVFGTDIQFNTNSQQFFNFTPGLKKTVDGQIEMLSRRPINKNAFLFLKKWYRSLNSTYFKVTNGYPVFIRNPFYMYSSRPNEMLEFSLMPEIKN